jgi:hypothetical protein
MGITNMKVNDQFILVLILLFLNACTTKTEVVKMDIKNKYPDRLTEYYMIKNPPEDIKQITDLVMVNLDTTASEYKEKIVKAEFYSQLYYKERFFFDRTYKPHYKWYNNFIYDDVRDGESHLEDRYVAIYLKNVGDTCHTCPNYPFYVIYSKKLVYYPNGFHNNPNKHWEKMEE